jgi:C4-dicarboxylate transporter DctM subunit
MKVSAMAIFISGSANLLSFILSTTRITNTIMNSLMVVINDRFSYLLVLMLFLFIVGCLLDTIASIILIAPIMVPLGIQLGVAPLHLGVRFVINLVIGFVTRRLDITCHRLCNHRLKFEEVVRGSMPFLIVEILALSFWRFPGADHVAARSGRRITPQRRILMSSTVNRLPAYPGSL